MRECLDYDDGTRHTCEACAGDLEMLRDALARSESARREAEENLAAATWTPSDYRVMELLVAEQELASERVSRESWEREANTANAERIRLHNEAENLSERLHQFEAAGFPNVATVLDRVEAERAARERAERERESQRSDAVKFHGMLLAAESSLSRAVEALREIAGEGLPIGSLPVCHRCKALRDAARAVLAEVGK